MTVGGSVGEWLAGLGLEQYADAFAENDVDLDVLVSLTREDLADLGVASIGHRRRILDAVARLRGPGPGAAEAVLERPAPEPSGGGRAERRNLTILMCDMVRSTELAARRDPEDVREVLEVFQNVCSGAIARFGGYVAKFMGDGVLAYFGYPNALENDAESAVRAGLGIVERLARAAPVAGERIAARIGIATGLVVVGDLIGRGGARERAVVGDTPNLAERMQRLAEPGAVLCGSVTRELAGDLFVYEDRGAQPLRGFDAPVQVWQVVRERLSESRFAATRLARMGRMIGRAEEKALLRERWKTACTGEGRLVLLAGDPGVGKSRLVQDFTEDAAGGEDHYRIAMQCSPHFRDSALFPAIRQLELSAGFESGDDAASKRAKLRALLAQVPGTARFHDELEMLLSLADADVSEEAASPETLRRTFLSALLGRLETMAGHKPVLVQFEDAHWMDPSTEDFITRLINRLERLPIMLLATYRHEFDCPWADHPTATLLKLNRLTRQQSAELVRDVIGEGTLPDRVIGEIVDRTDGVPLFIEEVARALVESGGLERRDRGEGAPQAPSVAVPATLQDTLLSRLDRDPRGKHVAQIGSIIGRDFRFALLAAIAPIEPEDLRAGLDALLESGLIVRQPDVSEELYSFKHGLLHQAAYDTVLLRRRQEIHRTIAETLESEFRDLAAQRPEVVAWHYRNGGQVEHAAQVFLRAGRLALTRGAYDEASRQLRAGLTALADLAESRERSDLELPLQIALAETLRSARLTGGDEALAACRRARELCTEVGDVDKLVRVLRLEFGINFNRPDVAAAEWVADEFLKVGERHGEVQALMLGRQGRGSLAVFRGELERAREEFAIGLALRDPARERALIAQFQYPTNSLFYFSIANFLTGRCAEARACLGEALALARRSTTFALSLTLANALIVIRMMRDDEDAREPLATLREIAGARGAPFWVDLVGFHDGWDLAQAGQAEAGLAKMTRAIETFSANAVEIEVPYYEALIAETCLAAGDATKALSFIDDALARVARTGERWCAAELHRLRAAALGASDPEAAARELATGRAIAAEQGALMWELRLAMTGRDLATDEAARRALAEDVRRISGKMVGCDGQPDLVSAMAGAAS